MPKYQIPDEVAQYLEPILSEERTKGPFMDKLYSSYAHSQALKHFDEMDYNNMSQVEMANYLHLSGAPVPGKGDKWNHSHVASVLKTHFPDYKASGKAHRLKNSVEA